MKFDFKKNQNLIIGAVVLLAVIGYGAGWWDFILHPTPPVTLLTDQQCADVASHLDGGVYYGPQLYDISACCVKDGVLQSCAPAETAGGLSMTVGSGGSTPFDTALVLVDVVNTGGSAMTATIQSISVSRGAGDNLTGYIQPSFIENQSLGFQATYWKEVKVNCNAQGCSTVPCTADQNCSAYANGTALCKDHLCKTSGTLNVPISQVYTGQHQLMDTQCSGAPCQVVWATAVNLNDAKTPPNPNVGIEMYANGTRKAGTTSFDIVIQGTDPSGHFTPITSHVIRDLQLGVAALGMSLDITYGYA